MLRRLFISVVIQFFMLVSLQAVPAPGEASDLSQEISTALAEGDTRTIAKYFNSSVQMILLSREGMYNNSQAEQILKNFFSQHQPSLFVLRHEGGSQTKGSRFMIGTLHTKTGTYRVSLFIKVIDGEMKVNQIRVEDDNE